MTVARIIQGAAHRVPARMKLPRLSIALTLACAALGAAAHDTWFEPMPAAGAGPLLALGTGNQFPLQESGIGAEYLVARGCRTAASSAAALRAMRNAPASLILQAPPGATTCWAELQPFEIELPADKVAIYFKDIQASPAVRAAWAEQQQRGLPWRERYTKHARIELAAGSPEPGAAAFRSPLGLDIVIDPAEVRRGATLQAQVLRDGLPLAGLAVELRSELSPLGFWRQTDDQGRISFSLPLAGRWVLRGVDLRPVEGDSVRWVSHFVSLAFEVPRADAQNGSSLRLNTLSINQVAATAAISSEPPSSTARR